MNYTPGVTASSGTNVAPPTGRGDATQPDPVVIEAQIAAEIAKELERNDFMGWFVANAASPLWVERTPEQEIGRVAAGIAYRLAAGVLVPVIAEQIAAIEAQFGAIYELVEDNDHKLPADLFWFAHAIKEAAQAGIEMARSFAPGLSAGATGGDSDE